MTDKPIEKMKKLELITLIEETSQSIAEINNFKQRIEAMETQINNSKEEADKFSEEMDEQREKYKKEIAEVESLRKMVLTLLPGAAAAGLAGSYIDAQKDRDVRRYWIGFTVSLLSLIALYGYNLFIEPILALLDYELFTKPTSSTWGDLFIRFTTGLPLVWIAWYCQKSISQTKRIKEEYQHKERIMRVYPAFIKQLQEKEKEMEQLSDKEQTKTIRDFITTTIKAIAKNPAEVLNPSETLLDSIKGRNKTEQ